MGGSAGEKDADCNPCVETSQDIAMSSLKEGNLTKFNDQDLCSLEIDKEYPGEGYKTLLQVAVET